MFKRIFPERFRRTARPYERSLTARLTERAGEVIVLAREEARHLRHNYLGTEHLLLGLLKEDEGTAAKALGSLNVTLDEVREQVESIVGYGEGEHGGPFPFPFTPRSKEVLEAAEREALRLGHHRIGTEHILLGLVPEPEGVAARALFELGIEPGIVRRAVEAVTRADRDEGGPMPGSSNRMIMHAKVEKLEVHVRCGVSVEERAVPQTLLVNLEYSYEANDEDDIAGMVDYGLLVEGAAQVLERDEFMLLETGVRMLGEYVLGTFPTVREVSVSVTKPRVPVARSLSGVSVSATFRR